MHIESMQQQQKPTWHFCPNYHLLNDYAFFWLLHPLAISSKLMLLGKLKTWTKDQGPKTLDLRPRTVRTTEFKGPLAKNAVAWRKRMKANHHHIHPGFARNACWLLAHHYPQDHGPPD